MLTKRVWQAKQLTGVQILCAIISLFDVTSVCTGDRTRGMSQGQPSRGAHAPEATH
jgi:hypothetical protein